MAVKLSLTCDTCSKLMGHKYHHHARLANELLRLELLHKVMSLERAVENLHRVLAAALHGDKHADLVEVCPKDMDHCGHQLLSFVHTHLSQHG
jgi:hypothetical protein